MNFNVLDFSFSEEEQFDYEGKILYNSDNEITGYVVNQYNEVKLKIGEEVYNSIGKLVRYKKYEYDKSKILFKEEEFDGNKALIMSIEYENSKNHIKKAIIRKGKKVPLFVSYDFAYYLDSDKLLHKVKSYYYEDEFEEPRVVMIKKTIYTYNKYGKIVEHYWGKPNKKDFILKLRSAEVYNYDEKNKITKVVLVNKDRKPIKLLKYVYNKENQVQEIKVFNVTGILKWSGDFDVFTKRNIRLIAYAVYIYSQGKLRSVLTEAKKRLN